MYSSRATIMDSDSQQIASARRSSQAMVIPLSRTTTMQWRSAMNPAGHGDKRPSAVLLALEIGRLILRTCALHMATSRLAVSTILALEEY